MDLNAVRVMATDLMTRTNLFARGWQLDLVDGPRGYRARTSHATKTIELSSEFLIATGPYGVRMQILHETAHAFAGPGRGHSRMWRHVVAAVGAKPWAIIWRHDRDNAWLNGPRFLEPTPADCASPEHARQYVRCMADRRVWPQYRDFWFAVPQDRHVGLWRESGRSPFGWFICSPQRRSLPTGPFAFSEAVVAVANCLATELKDTLASNSGMTHPFGDQHEKN